MGPLAVLIYFAFFSQVFGFAIEKRVSGKLLPNNGIDKYDDPSTWQIKYEKNKINGYYFQGDSIFDLPETVGMIYQDFPMESVNARVRMAKDKVTERMVVYVFAEKAILVLGIPLSSVVTMAKKNWSALKMAQSLWRQDVEITKRYSKGGQIETRGKISPLKDILAELQASGGNIMGAGVVGLSPGYQRPLRFLPAFDALGIVLYETLGIPVRPWESSIKSYDKRAFLTWVSEGTKPTLEISIGKEVVMIWKKGLEPYYAPSAEAISKWGIDIASFSDKDAFEDDCDTNENSASANPSVQEIFQIKSGRTNGGCDANRQKAIAAWLNESKEMAKAGLQAFLDASDGNKIAMATLEQFLGITTETSANEREITRKKLEQVSQFFHGSLNLGSGTPWLFCGSSWLEQKTWDDDSLDYDGDVKMSNGRPMKLKDDLSYSKYLRTFTATEQIPTDLVPYWSSTLKQYAFQKNYNNQGYCGFTGSQGGTYLDTRPSVMDLCPIAFSDTERSQKLGGRGAASVSLEKVLPRSGVLFHEVFHLVHAWDSPDASYNIDTIITALDSSENVPKSTNLDHPDDIKNYDQNDGELTNLELVRQNPETWVFFCVSYWYTLNKKIYFPFEGGNNGKGRSTE
ncbi:hypothetical protein N7510_006862 [Penicillium lagena]|uniref:uncharacterized protein n=1 Tax=Penicillium lagena TaxID=94218 RepID=UPI0025423173|nr:uncharacterized protein N7510_006862 [Penicillium lagena]KAJ5610143.1 hypothetical protein N7510_006862 [Penicillium lagena]